MQRDLFRLVGCPVCRLADELFGIVLELACVLQAMQDGEQAPEGAKGDVGFLADEDRGDGGQSADGQGQAERQSLE